MGPTEIGAGITETAQYRDGTRRTFETRTEAAVLCRTLHADRMEESRRYPAAWRLPRRHPLRGLRAEDIHVAEHGDREPVGGHVAHELTELERVPPDRRDRDVCAGGDIPCDPPVLVDAI